MSPTNSRPWYSVLLAALALSTVHARPIQDGDLTSLEARSPRLIPDTANYVHEVLHGLGLADAPTTTTPATTVTATPTPSAPKEHKTHTETVYTESDYPPTEHASQASVPSPGSSSESTGPTPTKHITYSSSTSYSPTQDSEEPGYTHSVTQHVSHHPANIEFMHGWSKDRKLTADDLPGVFDAVYRELKHQIGDAINSSDELGLDEFMANL